MWRKVLSLYLPWLATDLYRRRRFRGRDDRHSRSTPMVLVEADHGRQIVARCCPRSAATGVRMGMALSHARALLPEQGVVVLPFDSEQEARALTALAKWMIKFTPSVAVDPPNGLLLDMTGCERLYGGPHRMVRTVVQAVDDLGFQTRAAWAPTMGCAWALARFGPSRLTLITEPQEMPRRLAPLSIAALRLSADTVDTLQTIGVVNISHLMSLPRAALASRFGPELPRRLDQALGRVHEIIQPVQPEEPVCVEWEFAGTVTQLEALLLSVEKLVRDMVLQLHHRQQGVCRMVLKADRLDGPPVEHTIQLSRASRSTRHLWALLRPIVENLHMGFGIERLTLTAASATRQPQQQIVCTDWLEDTGPRLDDEHIGELVDVLSTRLGREHVLQARMAETYVPERTYAFMPADTETEHGRQDVAGVDADRPSLLYERPEPVQVVLMSPEGPVVSMSRRDVVHPIRTTIGPERITGRWWLGLCIGRPRDYYKLQDDAGCWWWVYRHVGTAKWFVHGQWM